MRRKDHHISSSSAIAIAILIPSAASLIPSDAQAACTTNGSRTTCDTAAPNPWTSRVGTGRNYNNATVEVSPGSTIGVGNTNAISVGDGATINVRSGATVTNSTTTNGNGLFGTGPNTIELGSNGKILVEAGGRVVETGTSRTAEAINLHGFGNSLTNYGLIQGKSSAAIWFQDQVTGTKNTIDNYGIIEKLGGGSVIGTSGGAGINFINRTNARVIGDLSFAGGNDNLTFEPGSLVTGKINGGSGTNSLFLQGTSGSSDTLAGAISNFTTLTKDGQGLWTVSGSLSGFTTVTVRDGTLALTGDNVNYTGNVIVQANGTLAARAQSLPTRTNPANNLNNVQNDGLVRFVQPDNGEYNGQIVGRGAVEKTGAGVLTLNPYAIAGNTYSGGTTIGGGTIAISADNALGSANGGLTFSGGALRFDRSFDLTQTRAITLDAGGGTLDTNGNTTTVSQAITGAGGLTKTGTGVLNLEGANSYAGQTTVTNGGLYVNGDQFAATGATTVQNGGTIGGVGVIGGDVTIQDGAILAPGRAGTAPGTLTINGDLNLSDGSSLDYSFGQANVVGGPLNDHTIVKGNLVLDGTINVATPLGGSFDPGIYRVISYDGSLTNNGLDIGTIPATGYYVQTSVDKQVNLVNTSGLNLNFWDVGPQFNGQVNGGTGVWQSSASGSANTNWTEQTGALNAPYQDGAFAIFMATAGTVTVDDRLGAVKASGMQFASNGYVVQGDVITLVGSPSSIIRVGDGTTEGAAFTATIDSELTGNSKLVKTDLGTLILNGDNTYTGGTGVNGGTLQISNNRNLGDAAGGISFNGGTLRTTDSFTIDRATELQDLGGTLETVAGTTLNYTGVFSGAGSLTKTGAGTTLLNAQNNYSGSTFVKAGTLAAGGENDLSASSDVNVYQSGTLALNDFNQSVKSLTNGGVIDFGQKAGTTLTTIGNYIGDGGMLVVTTVLGGDNSVTDKLAVNGDTSGNSVLKVTNAGGTGAQTMEGIKIIDVAGASGGNFTLLGDYVFHGDQAVVGGAYAYRLYKNGVTTPTDGDWYLRSSLVDPTATANPGDTANPGGASDPGGTTNPLDKTDPGASKPLYQPGVPIYEAYAQTLLGLNGLPTLRQRVGDRSWAPGGSGATTGDGVWARIDTGRTNIDAGTSTSGTSYDYSTWQFQAGVDGEVFENDSGSLIAGVTGRYGTNAADIFSIYGDGKVHTAGYGFGGTLTWYDVSGLYVDGQAQATWYDSDLSSGSINRGLAKGNNGFGYAFGLETGKRIDIAPAWSLIPQAQLVYSRVTFDGFTDPFAAGVSLNDGESLRARLGLSIDYCDSWRDASGQPASVNVYGITNLYDEFLSGTKATVSGTAFANAQDRLWGGLGVGGSYDWGNGKYSLYGEGSINTSLANIGDNYAYKGTVGFRVNW